MITANAPHPDLAHTFINSILGAKIGSELSSRTCYSSPNQAAQPVLDKALQEPPPAPTDTQMDRLHFTPSLKGNDLQVFQRCWTDVRSC